jgi:hypothetical protein
LLIDGYRGLKERESKIAPRLRKEVTAAAARIAPFYDAWGKPDEAARWRHELQSAEEPTHAEPR